MKLLIADDQPYLRALLQEQVRPWGYETFFAEDGFAALQALLAPDGPKLALLDWLMPGLDGIEVCRRFRQEEEGAYVYLVLMTGQGGREAMLEGLQAGADDFLCKPIDAAELKARLGAGRRIVTLQEQLRVMATRDALTNVWNRAALLGILAREMARAAREGRPLAVVLADVDRFKSVNDTHGHEAGDAVLREVARRMRAALRPYDALGRYGGEEFLAVLPGCGPAEALNLAGRLRGCVAAGPIDAGPAELRVTISLGVAGWDGAADASALLRAADAAMYHAKRGGRDRAVLAEAAAEAAS
jgi:diguanylate cyclase (GGDEF)-like protein